MRFNRLNGWQRLWVLASVIYILIIIILAIVSFPSPENYTETDKILKNLSTKSLDILAGKSRGVLDKLADEQFKRVTVKYPNDQILEFLSSTNKADIEYVSKDYWGSVTKLTNTKRIIFLFDMFLAWVVPCVILYSLGWSTGWVIRGFKIIE